jgi:hypothetical protein
MGTLAGTFDDNSLGLILQLLHQSVSQNMPSVSKIGSLIEAHFYQMARTRCRTSRKALMDDAGSLRGLSVSGDFNGVG